MNIDFSSSVSFIPTDLELKTIRANEYDELQKLATQYKEDNWRLSLTCLFKAKSLLFSKGTDPVLQQVTRFAVFLQQAGFFEEAKSELQDLLNNADEFAQNDVRRIRKNKKLFKKYYKTLYLEHLFDKASLIYKRQKLFQEANELRQISLEYTKKREELRQKIDDIEKKELEEFEKECEELNKMDLPSVDELIATAEKQKSRRNKIDTPFLAKVVWLVIFILIMFITYILF